MIQVTSDIFTTKQIGEYTFKKSVNDNMIIEEVEADLLLQNEEAKAVIEKTIQGESRTDANVVINCGVDIIKQGYLSYNEGKLDLQGCRATKKIYLNNSIDCVADGTINIFDYTPQTTKTVQGTLTNEGFNKTYYQRFNQDYSLNDIINIIDEVDRSSEGFFIEHLNINVESEIKFDDTYGYDIYLYHRIDLQVLYVKITDTIQNDENWLPNAGGGFYLNLGNPPILLDRVNYVYINQNETQIDKYFFAGKPLSYQNTNISNTYRLNEILVDIFACTGNDFVSCFFDINSDNTQPVNSAYDFANKYCHNLRIAQSFDIIREDEIQDSFGSSGIIKKEELIKDLCKVFNLVVIKTSTEIRVEHISYYVNKGIDVTTLDYQIDEIEVNKDLVSSEVFQFAAKTNTQDFFEVTIEYEKPKFTSDTNEVVIKSELFLSDIIDTLNNEKYNESEYEDLFFLLSCDSQGRLIGFNSALSMKSIFFALHTTQRPLRQGNYKNNIVNFNGYSIGFSSKLRMVSSYINYENLQPFYSVKTNEGTFLITEIETNENKELILSLKK